MKVKLYKYTPHIESFLDHPMLRVTRAVLLNDPFELNPSQDLLDIVVRSGRYDSLKSITEQDKKRYLLNQIKFNKGVVSLSECKDNILMWSHYADNHQGAVIEFSFNLELESHSNNLVQRGFFEKLADNAYQYGIVKYRKNRMFDTSTLDMDKANLLEQLINNIAFVKSKDWVYEEEHRFLVNSNFCDVTLIEDTIENRAVLERHEVAAYELNNGDLAWLSIPPNHKFKLLNDFPLFVNEFTNRENLMQFASIRASCVSGVYLGCKMPVEMQKRIIGSKEKLEKFTNLNDNIFRSKIDKNRFELSFEKVSE